MLGEFSVLIGLVIAAVLGVFGFGALERRKGRKDKEDEFIKDDLETAKRIDRVRELDADAARERLRDRNNARDL